VQNIKACEKVTRTHNPVNYFPGLRERFSSNCNQPTIPKSLFLERNRKKRGKEWRVARLPRRTSADDSVAAIPRVPALARFRAKARR
jgi:hypothetical protein